MPTNSKIPRTQPAGTLPVAKRGVFVSHVSTAIRAKRWHDAAMWSVLVFVSVVAFAAVAFAMVQQGTEYTFASSVRATRKVSTVAAPTTVRRPLDGVMVPVDTPAIGYFAVMIDNMIDALPQSGVAKAPLVIEAPVEGGITRLLAVYPSDAVVAKIGPVRSARPYYIEWAAEFDALYVHSGGSPEALTRLKTVDSPHDFNEFFNGEAFWRESSRIAPHNLYTSSTLLAKALGTVPRRGLSPLSVWRFKDDALLQDRPEGVVRLTLGEEGKWKVFWLYDQKTNAWTRIMHGSAQSDLGGDTVTAKNVAVQITKVVVLDEIGRRRVDTTSGGDAFLAIDGHVLSGTWKKQNGRTRFYDAAGNELSFNAGTTWIEVISADTPVKY